MSENVQVLVVLAVGIGIQALISGIVACFIRRLDLNHAKQSEDLEMQISDVKQEVELNRIVAREGRREDRIQLDSLASLANATHVLVHRNREFQLGLHKEVTRRLADLTGKEDDIRAADMAETEYTEHVKTWGEVDGMPGTDAQKQGRS